MKKRTICTKLTLVSALAAVLFLLLPAVTAFAADAAENTLDASSAKAAQAALWAFLGGGFIKLIFGAIRARSFGGIRAAFGVLLSLMTAAFPLLNAGAGLGEKIKAYQAKEPAYMSEYEYESAGLVTDADFYVSPDGNDGADGSFAHPFATVEKARDAVRALDKSGRSGVTVALKAGDYRVSHIDFSYEDGGTEDCPVLWCAYGDGEVVLNGGLSIDPAAFSSVSPGKPTMRVVRR